MIKKRLKSLFLGVLEVPFFVLVLFFGSIACLIVGPFHIFGLLKEEIVFWYHIVFHKYEIKENYESLFGIEAGLSGSYKVKKIYCSCGKVFDL